MEYRMKKVIEKTGLTEKAIRFYIAKGILSPREVEQNGRVSYFFSDEQIEMLNNIYLLRYFGFSIKQIKILYNNNPEEIQEVLMRHDALQKEKKKIISMWEENSMCISEITNVDQLVECLQKSKNI